MSHRERKLNRKPEFDYGAPECYFVTVCTQNRQQIFELEEKTPEIDAPVERGGVYILPDRKKENQIIHKWIIETQNKYKNVRIPQYVIMPDHVHMIVDITMSSPDCTLSAVMQFFKTMTTNEYIWGVNEGVFQPFCGKLWQKSYNDHIISDWSDYHMIREYIKANPAKWMERRPGNQNATSL